MSIPDPDPVADALAQAYPLDASLFDPEDITTWPVDQLDQLGLWQAAVDGLEIVDHPDGVAMLDESNRHGLNAEDEMLVSGDDG